MRKKKLIKIIRGAVLSFLVMFLAFCIPIDSHAETTVGENGEIIEVIDLSDYILQVGGLNESTVQLTEDGEYFFEEHWLSNGTQSLDNVIYEALKNKTNCIDISSYHVTLSELSITFSRVVNQHPELFYVTGGVTSISYGDYVSEIYPGYDASYTDEHVKIFNQKVEQIMSGVDSSWPTIEKILYLHDYLVTNITYDMSQNNHNAYNALIDGSCVCEGYSLAFACLLRNIGVNVEVVSSKDMVHAWNLIELNGEYFYTDVTWDDPVGGGETYCRHSNFMVDRDGMVATGHDSTDWSGKISGKNIYNNITTSSRYVDYFWKDVETAVPLIGTKAGYLSEGKFNIYDFANNTTNSYDRIIGSWRVWNTSNRWWSIDYCAMAATGDAFYYTTEDTIYRINLDGTTTPTYTITSDEAAKGYLYGLTASGRNLTYILRTESDGDATYTGTYRIVTPIDSFVTRMYQQCLSRNPDLAGLEGWVGQLEGGYMDGAAIAEQFVFSQEMLAKNLSDDEFVTILYRAMMGREADAAGKSGWVSQLNGKYMTRSEVTKAFVESVEFTDICTSYGITRGTYDASMASIEKFVTRFYTLCLERNADQLGLYGWVNNLKNQYMNGAQIANVFFFSDEFINKNVSNEKYIELLYNTLMGRPSDESGKSGWLSQLKGGHMTRKDMMKAFIESSEFTKICNTYGITRGSL